MPCLDAENGKPGHLPLLLLLKHLHIDILTVYLFRIGLIAGFSVVEIHQCAGALRHKDISLLRLTVYRPEIGQQPQRIQAVFAVFADLGKFHGNPQAAILQLDGHRYGKAVTRKIIDNTCSVFRQRHRGSLFIDAAGAAGTRIRRFLCGIDVADN